MAPPAAGHPPNNYKNSSTGINLSYTYAHHREQQTDQHTKCLYVRWTWCMFL